MPRPKKITTDLVNQKTEVEPITEAAPFMRNEAPKLVNKFAKEAAAPAHVDDINVAKTRAPRAKKEPAYKLPKKLAVCVDDLVVTRDARLALQKEIDNLQKIETQLKDHLINNLSKEDATGIAGKLARVTIVTKVVPQVNSEDWDTFYAYVGKTKSWDMLQKRLSDTAIKARWDAKKEVPGVSRFTAVTVSINKV